MHAGSPCLASFCWCALLRLPQSMDLPQNAWASRQRCLQHKAIATCKPITGTRLGGGLLLTRAHTWAHCALSLSLVPSIPMDTVSDKITNPGHAECSWLPELLSVQITYNQTTTAKITVQLQHRPLRDTTNFRMTRITVGMSHGKAKHCHTCAVWQ